MRHELQVELTERLLSYLDEKSTAMVDADYPNDVREYFCPDRLVAEREKLFNALPICLGLSCDLREPGTYQTEEVNGIPLLLVRAADGILHGLINTCRHRGARLTQDRNGRFGNSISCPYHAWTYALNGSLKAAPFAKGFAPLEGTHLGRIPVTEHLGMIWLLPHAEFALANHLAEVADDLSSYGLDDYHHYRSVQLTETFNWKLTVDTFLESYHIGVLHRETIAPILHGNLGTFDALGAHLRMAIARKSIEELKQLPKDAWDLIVHTAIVYVLFPNTVFIVQGDHIEVFRVFPHESDPNKCTMWVSLYTPEPTVTDKAKRHWDSNFKLLLDTVELEDFPLTRNMQKDFRRGAVDKIVYGKHEPSLSHFHATINRYLGGTPSLPLHE